MGSSFRVNIIILDEDEGRRRPFATPFEEEVGVSAHRESNIVFSREIPMGQFLAVQDDFASPEIPVVFAVEDVGDAVRYALILVPIQELFNLSGAHEVALETGDEWEVAEESARSLTVELENLESQGWVGAKDATLLKAIAAALRGRGTKCTFQKITGP
jgi:hypothetical protein